MYMVSLLAIICHVLAVVVNSFTPATSAVGGETMCPILDADLLEMSMGFHGIIPPEERRIAVFTAMKYVDQNSDTLKIEVEIAAKTGDFGRMTFEINGEIKGERRHGEFLPTSESRVMDADKLVFHPRCGRNAVVVDGGKKAYNKHKNNDEFAAVLTSRPLRRGEIFQAKATKFFDIGITTEPPQTILYPKFMKKKRTNGPMSWTWVPPSKFVSGGNEKDYGPVLSSYKIEDILGVMVNANNELHFFQNGTDVGIASTGIPDRVYAFVEVYSNTTVEIVYD